MRSPLILEIKGNSLDDGPGIRSVVFFKGCPLSCAWCHNPESIDLSAELSFDASACIDCGACSKSCAQNAIAKSNPLFIDRDQCNLCFECVTVCPAKGLTKVGSPMSIDSIMARLKKDKPFYDNSGGGVTLSGGEPTLHMDFASVLLQRLKGEGIHTLLETCGHFNFDLFVNKMLPYLDCIYFDLKIHDQSAHKNYCGKTNSVILDNFAKLYRIINDHNQDYHHVELLPRVPLIPDMTDNNDNLLAIGRFLADLGVKKAAQLSYNPLWHQKTQKIGAQNPYQSREVLHKWISKEHEHFCKAIFQSMAIEVVH
jgi:pyruvate formate lyase activating enzyme